MTLGAWLVAFGVVVSLLALFGHRLATMPLALRALVMSGLLVILMVNLAMPLLAAAAARWLRGASPTNEPEDGHGPGPLTSVVPEHPRLETLPDWPARTIAVLSTVNRGAYAIPVSAPQRTEDGRILLGLRRDRGSLARLRQQPHVALTILAEGDIALTARGRARIFQEPMATAPDYAAVAIDVHAIDDHRQPAFVVDSGVERRWVDEFEQRALRKRVEALNELAVGDIAPGGSPLEISSTRS